MPAWLKRRFRDNPPAFAVGAGATALGGFVVALLTDAETAIAAQSMVLAPIFIAEHILQRRSSEDRDQEPDKAGEEQRHADDIENHAEDGWCARISGFLRRHAPSRIKVDTLSIWMIFHLADPEQQKPEPDHLKNLVAAPNCSGRDGCTRDGEGNVPVSRIVDAVHKVLPYTRVEVHLSEPSFIRKNPAPTDGRPCTMEAFVAALLAEGLDAPVIKGAISAWIKGDWQAALLPLSDDARARLTGKGGAA